MPRQETCTYTTATALGCVSLQTAAWNMRNSHGSQCQGKQVIWRRDNEAPRFSTQEHDEQTAMKELRFSGTGQTVTFRFPSIVPD